MPVLPTFGEEGSNRMGQSIVLKTKQHYLYMSITVLLFMTCSRSLSESCIQATWARKHILEVTM